MPLKPKHKIGILTGGVIALAIGSATAPGYLQRKEGVPKARNVAIHQKFDPRGVVTVCSGITNYDIKTLKAGDVYTRAMCDDALTAASERYNAQIAACLPADFMVGDHEHTAILSFEYNVGQHNFCNGPVGRAFRAGKREEGCLAMGQYVRAAGVVLPGLVNRRYDKFDGEISWCLRDD